MEAAPEVRSAGFLTGPVAVAAGPCYKASVNRSTDELLRAAEAWIADDPDPETRAELEALVARRALDELAERFAGELEFGTAGLRGLMGAGPMRMNRRVVLRAVRGLVDYLAAHVPGAAERGIVLGFDARRNSALFADDAVSIVTGAGFRAHVFREAAPTPLAAFALLETGAAAACVLTASHNPPAYNGLKVYWGNGAQIIPPHDAGIAAAIARVGRVADLPRPTRAEAEPAGLVRELGDALSRAYLDGLRATLGPTSASPLRIAYTALHGVGERVARQALAEAGFDDVTSVASQAAPDGAFPTVRFPNPEEPEALAEVLALAARIDADLVLANDPDADRLAVAARHEGELVVLDGNEIGCLLAHRLLSQGTGKKRLVLSTVVSSPMLGAIAAAHGARWEPTLTGHKWIHNRAMELEREGYATVFGYEEALGYAVGTRVRDKDGISAAVAIAEAAAGVKREGRTLVDELDLMARRYGLFRSRLHTETHAGSGGLERIAAAVERFRREPPTSLSGLRVVTRSDYKSSTRTTSEGVTSPIDLPKSNVLAFELEGGHRVMLRPSGTEPKLKVYFDVRVDVADGESIAGARDRADALLGRLVDDVKARLASD